MTDRHMRLTLTLSADCLGSGSAPLACTASKSNPRAALVERKMLASDRRVKTVVLTPRGLKKTADVKKRLYKPPAELLDLDEETLEVLRDAFSAEAIATPEEVSAGG